MEQRPRLRDSKHLTTKSLYPLNVIPPEIVTKIGGYLVYLLYIGRKDVSGNDWGDAFADSIGGIHLDSPVGIADVVLDKNCWSAKTGKVKAVGNGKTLIYITSKKTGLKKACSVVVK